MAARKHAAAPPSPEPSPAPPQPMSLMDVRHQLPAQRRLQRAAAAARVPHAYIFHGPDGVGREMLARAYAKMLLCQRPRRDDGSGLPPEYAGQFESWLDSCGSCASCALMAVASHPDCHIVHRQLNKYHEDAVVRARKGIDLGVDVIRQFVIAPAARKASMGERKVFIIRESERMSDSAQNALLKTLEEPPAGTVLILITRAPDALLATTRSRCQAVSFGPLPPGFVAQILSDAHPEAAPQAVHYAAHHEPGSPGRALTWLEDGGFEANERLFDALAGLTRRGGPALASGIEELGKELGGKIAARSPDATESDALREALQRLFAMIATFYRDLLHQGLGTGRPLCNQHRAAELEAIGRRVGRSGCHDAIRAAAAAEQQLELNANTRLCLDALAIQLARIATRR